MSEPSRLNSQYCVARLLPGPGVVLCCVGTPLLPVLMILSPWVPNIHLTMFTENYFVHRLFQACALHQPCVALVCVSRHNVCTTLLKLSVAV